MSDRIAVIADGQVEQVGPPRSLLASRRRPTSPGSWARPTSSTPRCLGGQLRDLGACARRCRAGRAPPGRRRRRTAGAAAIVVRPERIAHAGAESTRAAGHNVVAGTVVEVVYLGRRPRSRRRRATPRRLLVRDRQPGRAALGRSTGSPVHCECTQDAAAGAHPCAAVVVDDPVLDRSDALSLSETQRRRAVAFVLRLPFRALRVGAALLGRRGRARARRTPWRCRRRRRSRPPGRRGRPGSTGRRAGRRTQREPARRRRPTSPVCRPSRRSADQSPPRPSSLDPGVPDLGVAKRRAHRSNHRPHAPGISSRLRRRARTSSRPAATAACGVAPSSSIVLGGVVERLLGEPQRVDEQPVPGAEVVDDQGRSWRRPAWPRRRCGSRRSPAR